MKVGRVTAHVLRFMQLVPPSIMEEYEDYPTYGDSLLWKWGLQQPIHGQYCSYLRHLVFTQGISQLVANEIIQEGTTVMVKVEPTAHAMRLDLVEIINQV